MHGNFAGHIAPAGYFVAIVIADYQVVRLHHSLADSGGSGEDAVFIQAERNVPVVRGDETIPVDPPANLHDFAAYFVFSPVHAHWKFRPAGYVEGYLCASPESYP